MKKTLHLNLIRKWFDMIKRKVEPKKEEYRKITPYFCARFIMWCEKKETMKWWKIQESSHRDFISFIIHNIKRGTITFIHHDTITFSNGMTPPVPRFEIEKKGISIGIGNPSWGAVPGKRYFILELGEIIES